MTVSQQYDKRSMLFYLQDGGARGGGESPAMTPSLLLYSINLSPNSLSRFLDSNISPTRSFNLCFYCHSTATTSSIWQSTSRGFKKVRVEKLLVRNDKSLVWNDSIFFLSHLYIMDCQLLSLAEYNRYWYRVEISWDFWAAREKYLNQIRISRGFSQVGDARSSYCLPPSYPSLFDKRSPCRDPHKAMLY